MGDSFYHIFITPYLFLLTSFFEARGVGIHNAISKNISHSYQRKYVINKHMTLIFFSDHHRKNKTKNSQCGGPGITETKIKNYNYEGKFSHDLIKIQ
jgi:hypothetical protein